MWRRCIEIFAAGAWHDRRRHVVQRRLELNGHVCFKWCETCIALMAVHTAQPSMPLVVLQMDIETMEFHRGNKLLTK